jgi:hypothetical protein
MKQTEQILTYLKSGKAITPLEALTLWGCFRLGARIWDLKHQGYDIRTEIIEDNGKHYAKYQMVNESYPH